MGATTVPREKSAARKATNGTAPTWKPELHDIPLDAIDVGANVRTDVAGLDELAASIRSVGVLSPIRVEEAGAGRYALVYGQRRLAAAREAGLATIPALVDANNRTGTVLVVAQLVENLQRHDLNPLEEAAAFRQLLDAEPKLTQAALATQVGRSAPYVSNALRLLKLGEPIKEAIRDGRLSGTAGRAVASLPPAEATELARRAEQEKLSTHQLEAEVARAQGRASADDRRRDAARNRDKELLAGWLALLLKKKASPETTTLVGWAGIPADGLAALAKRGWERSQSAARGVDQAWRAPAPKGFCDCDAYELSYRLGWSAGGETYKPTLTAACIVKAHQTAADKAERAAFDAQQAEQSEVERKAREEREAGIAPLASAVTTPIPPTKAKLILFTLLGGDRNNGYWNANQWADRGLRYDGWVDQLWDLIDALPHERLLSEIARLVATAAINAGGKVRTTIDGLAEQPILDPDLGAMEPRAAKPARAKKAAAAS